MKKVLIATSISMLMASGMSYAGFPIKGQFNDRATKSYTINVAAATTITDQMTTKTTEINTDTNDEFLIAYGKIIPSIGTIYVSAPANAVSSFNSANKSWVVGAQEGVEDSGLTIRFDNVGTPVDGREINSGLPAYPPYGAQPFSLLGKKGKNAAGGSYAVNFDYAVWVN